MIGSVTKCFLIGVIITAFIVPVLATTGSITLNDTTLTYYPYDRIFTFTMENSSLYDEGYMDWTVPTNITNVFYLLAGGGGSGGGAVGAGTGGYWAGGGGGGGELLVGNATLVPGTVIPIFVGNGGQASSGYGLPGTRTSFGSTIARGGGAGGSPLTPYAGGQGGSGGGGATPQPISSVSPIVPGGSPFDPLTGSAGGSARNRYNPYGQCSGGGGGAISAGEDCTLGVSLPLGGEGLNSSIGLNPMIYSNGGLGGYSYGYWVGSPGLDNSGGGGGGGSAGGWSGDGGSGVIIIRTAGNYTPGPSPTPTPTPTPYPTVNKSYNNYIVNHQVRFEAKDQNGKPISDLSMTVISTESTVPLDWIPDLFGFNLGTTPMLNTTMTGTTGTDGAAVFLMMPTAKYKVDYVSISHNINETRYYYPKEDSYLEIFWTDEPVISHTQIKYTLYNQTINNTYMNLNFTYSDSLNTTTDVIFYVQDSNKTTVYTHTYLSGTANLSGAYAIQVSPGNTTFWSISAHSTQYDKRINVTNYITFDNKRWMVDIFGASEPGASTDIVETASFVYNATAIALITIFGLIFSRQSVRFGVVIVPLMAGLFKFMGWLNVDWIFIGIGLALGVIIAFRYAEEESS